VPAGGRQSPQGEVRNALLAPGIPAYPRLARKHQDRPVTPEVAGSSPVAPVKLPANQHVVLSALTPEFGRLHKRCSGRPETGEKGPGNPVRE
jgi:hypothetical protein